MIGVVVLGESKNASRTAIMSSRKGGSGEVRDFTTLWRAILKASKTWSLNMVWIMRFRLESRGRFILSSCSICLWFMILWGPRRVKVVSVGNFTENFSKKSYHEFEKDFYLINSKYSAGKSCVKYVCKIFSGSKIRWHLNPPKNQFFRNFLWKHSSQFQSLCSTKSSSKMLQKGNRTFARPNLRED